MSWFPIKSEVHCQHLGDAMMILIKLLWSRAVHFEAT